MIPPPTDAVPCLLVDDLEENLLALDALLRREGLLLLKARSGTEALELLLQHDMALALIDVQMPSMDGFELAELMRGTARTRRVPIIFLTAGTADRQRRFRGYETGAVDFLHKPLEADILRSKVDVFIELFRQRQEVTRQRDELKAATEQIGKLLTESRQYAGALQEAARRKDEFLAMLAHELRNPLAPVRNAVEVLRLAGPVDSVVGEASEIIDRQVAHMARLIDDLLDMARIVRGQVQLRTERCDLAKVVRQTAEDYRPTLAAAGVKLQVTIPDHPLWLVGDPVRLAQVVGNLLHNASKFTDKGGQVTVTVGTDSTGGATVAVRDTGAGLDPAVLARLFEPFSQGDQPLDRSKGGLGLGLALARGLIELHGGSVTAESAGLGYGSTFTLRLPLSEADEVIPIQPAESTSEVKTGGLRIVIVEDKRDAAESLRLLLSLQGYEVAVAFDAEEGLAVIGSFQPDVVVSDLGLPGELDGYALARAVRADASLAGVTLIALSGYGQDNDRQRTQDAGFDRHLVKPVDPGRLATVLSAIPRRTRSGS